MPDRIAIKQLTASDLSFFETRFRQTPNQRQKAINLNADVFVTRLYPGLAGTGPDREIPVAISLHGPGEAPAFRVTRSVTKRPAYKNWRLNGEFIRDPDLEPGRFDAIVPGDLAVLEFSGEPEPIAVRLVLVTRTADPALVAELAGLVPGGRRTMVEITRTALGAAADRAAAPPGHPIRLLTEDAERDAVIADAAAGDVEAVRSLRRWAGRPVTADELARAKLAAAEVGADGEALAALELERRMTVGEIVELTWTSSSDAAAAWDFEARLLSGEVVRIEVKSTRGPFERTLHLSAAELAAAAEAVPRYDLWRIHAMDDDGAVLRVAAAIGDFARAVLAGLALPPGVRVDGFSLDPAAVPGWSADSRVDRPDEP